MKLIITGGTIDKIYCPELGELGFDSSIVPQLLKEARVDSEFDVSAPFMIDSFDMNDHHREQVLEIIMSSEDSNKILITHGTDTMVETAQFLQRRLPSEHQKTVVLTGAMVPARMPHSDAQFNLGFSHGTLELLKFGVYVAMNGKVFSPSTCVKNKTLGRFEQRTEKVNT